MRNETDALIVQQGAQTFDYIVVFVRQQALAMLDNRQVAAEAPHRLRQFDPDISTADHRQMFGDHIQLQRPDVRHRLGLGKRLRFRPGLRHASLKADVPLFGKDVRDM
jgi:hypothetical protein